MNKNKRSGVGVPVAKDDSCFDSQSGPSDLKPGYGEIQDHKEHMELYYRFHNEDAGVLKLRFTQRTHPEFHRGFLAHICPQPRGTYRWLPPFLCLWNGDCGERKIRFQIPEGDKRSDPFLPTPEDNNQTLNKINYVDHGDRVEITIERELDCIGPGITIPEGTFFGQITGIEKHCRHRKGGTKQEDLKKCPCKGQFKSAWQRKIGSGEFDWHVKNKAGVGSIHPVDKHLESLTPRGC